MSEMRYLQAEIDRLADCLMETDDTLQAVEESLPVVLVAYVEASTTEVVFPPQETIWAAWRDAALNY